MNELTHAEREHYEERAAIMEYEGELDREAAELEAMREIAIRRIRPERFDFSKVRTEDGLR